MSEGRREDLEPRVSALEREMAEVRDEAAQARADAAAARVLSAGADRDVSEVRAELRAHTRAISALRQTQVEFDVSLRSLERTTHDGLAEVRAGLDDVRVEMRAGFADVYSQLHEMRGGFATMQTGMTMIVDLLRRDDPDS